MAGSDRDTSPRGDEWLPASRHKADYGIDAPNDLRALLVAGGLMVLLSGMARASNRTIAHRCAAGCGWTGGSLLVFAAFMVFSSKVLKLNVRDRLIEGLDLQGDEQVLDVGCGRGLTLIAAAKQLTSGRAVGIDLWSAEDLSANTASATLANAAVEGVSTVISVDTGDMRDLPYADASFDAVVSMTAVHNIKDAAGRRKALKEMIRVLKPNGRLALFDIFHPFSYTEALRSLNLKEVHVSGPLLLWGVPGVCIFAQRGHAAGGAT